MSFRGSILYKKDKFSESKEKTNHVLADLSGGKQLSCAFPVNGSEGLDLAHAAIYTQRQLVSGNTERAFFKTKGE